MSGPLRALVGFSACRMGVRRPILYTCSEAHHYWGEDFGFQVDKLRPIYTSNKSPETVGLEPECIILRNLHAEAPCLLGKSGQARSEAGSRSFGQEGGPGGWRGTQPMAASVLAERSDPGASSATGTFEDGLSRWGSQIEL